MDYNDTKTIPWKLPVEIMAKENGDETGIYSIIQMFLMRTMHGIFSLCYYKTML